MSKADVTWTIGQRIDALAKPSQGILSQSIYTDQF